MGLKYEFINDNNIDNNNLELVNENYNKELTETINNILLKINLEDNIVQKKMFKIKYKPYIG